MVLPSFISWIRHPRMVAWFLLIAVAWVAVRLPFANVFFLASVAEFFPGFVLAPMAGLYAGPAGVAGIAAGTLLGDLLLGHWGEMTTFRVLAYGLSALYMMALSHPGRWTTDRREFWRIGFLLVPICLTAAAWIAAGGALRRLYPFAYLLGLNAAQFLVFSALFAPAVWHVLARHWIPRFGTWQEVLGQADDGDPAPFAGRMLIWVGALMACVAGALFSGFVYGVWPIGSSGLGQHTGAWVTIPVCLSLMLQIIGVFLCGRRIRSRTAPEDTRFERMYLPPLEKR